MHLNTCYYVQDVSKQTDEVINESRKYYLPDV